MGVFGRANVFLDLVHPTGMGPGRVVVVVVVALALVIADLFNALKAAQAPLDLAVPLGLPRAVVLDNLEVRVGTAKNGQDLVATGKVFQGQLVPLHVSLLVQLDVLDINADVVPVNVLARAVGLVLQINLASKLGAVVVFLGFHQRSLDKDVLGCNGLAPKERLGIGPDLFQRGHFHVFDKGHKRLALLRVLHVLGVVLFRLLVLAVEVERDLGVQHPSFTNRGDQRARGSHKGNLIVVRAPVVKGLGVEHGPRQDAILATRLGRQNLERFRVIGTKGLGKVDEAGHSVHCFLFVELLVFGKMICFWGRKTRKGSKSANIKKHN